MTASAHRKSPLLLPAVLAAFLLLACAAQRPLTPVSASTLAAQLANDQCRKRYGKTPFAADDFEALLESGRWHWGTPDGGKVDGFEVQVSFDAQGGSRQVDVQIPPE